MKRRLQEALRKVEEQEAVLDLVKELVERYGLTAKDLFPRHELEKAAGIAEVDQRAPYCDRSGNTWSGRGRRPLWLLEALEAGATLEEFRNVGFRR